MPKEMIPNVEKVTHANGYYFINIERTRQVVLANINQPFGVGISLCGDLLSFYMSYAKQDNEVNLLSCILTIYIANLFVLSSSTFRSWEGDFDL